MLGLPVFADGNEKEVSWLHAIFKRRSMRANAHEPALSQSIREVQTVSIEGEL